MGKSKKSKKDKSPDDKKTSFYQFGTKPSDKQKKKKGFEFQKSNYGKIREEPTTKGFMNSDLQKRNRERRRIKNLKAYKESQKKIDAKNQRHRMEISQAEWEEKWEKIFGKKKFDSANPYGDDDFAAPIENEKK